MDRVIEFIEDEERYLQWVINNLSGYVINTTRSMSPKYMVLHKADCYSIREPAKSAKPGGFTERNYIKICSVDIESLRKWVRKHGRADGSFSRECHFCRPL